MNDVMLDIETIGIAPGSVILSIGAVSFNLEVPDNQEDYDIFYKEIKISSCVKSGLTMNPNTIVWWMTQSENARNHFIECQELGVTLREALASFKLWLVEHPNSHVWGNSNRFDCGILAEAYNKLGVKIPWNGKLERDMRTYIMDHMDQYQPSDVRETDHDPIKDCYYQIDVLKKVYKLKQKLN